MRGVVEGWGVPHVPPDYALRAELEGEAKHIGPRALHARLADVDPDAAARIDHRNVRRVVRALEVYQLTGKPISSFQRQFEAERPLHDWVVIGLRRDKGLESRRINARVRKMVEKGLVDEVASLLAEHKPLSRQARCAIGYAEIIEHLAGRVELDEAIERIKINTRRLAKGQRTWFKTFRGVHWIDISPEGTDNYALEHAKDLILGKGKPTA